MGSTRKKDAAIGVALTLAATASVAGSAEAAGEITVTNTHDSGPGSLRAAMNGANGSTEANRILFKAGLSGEIKLTSDLPATSSPVSIVGPGRKRLSVNGMGEHLVFHLLRNATISGLTIRNGYRESVYVPPSCGGWRGCSYYDYGPAGGAITVENKINVTVKDSAFVDNRGEFGGAISIYGEAGLKVRNSTFSLNISENSGGAITATNGATLEVSSSTFTGNSADGGGAISASGPDIRIADSNFSTNVSTGSSGGGAVQAAGIGSGPGARISGSTFRENSARGNGGGVSLSGDFRLSRSTVSNNNAGGAGGGIALSPYTYLSDGGRISSIDTSTITGNTSGANSGSSSFNRGGGGIWIGGYSGSTNLSLSNLTVAGNSSIDGNGGGVSSQIPGVSFDSVTITGNRAVTKSKPVNGGGFNQVRGPARITNSIIIGNSAGDIDDLSFQPFLDQPHDDFIIDYSLYGQSSGVSVNTDYPGSNLVDVKPGLGKLADNGGPTRTMKPSADSPVINRGASFQKRDQRGQVRPVHFDRRPGSKLKGGDWSDMGAVELQDSRFSFNDVQLNRQEGNAILTVRVRSAGRLVLLKSDAIIGSIANVGGPGSRKVKVSPRGAAAVELNRTGKVHVKARVRFKPPVGKARVKTISLNLRRR